jgi:tRNA-uridine 2-sulfurtransferase
VRVLVGMSGGVDSSIAAALLRDQGHDVTGVTLRLWGGESDSGCCSVADVDDARRVAQQLGIDHLVFNFSDDFDEHVVSPYVGAHASGSTPNPCIECNRHLKFDRLVQRADALGFDAVATGHHARVVRTAWGTSRIARGVDHAKDQSYVLYVVAAERLDRVLLPIGELTKADVRAQAERLGLRTAAKPDSQDVCFITSTGGREAFLGPRIPMRAGVIVDRAGERLGHIENIELVTLGQRKGLGLAGGAEPRYVVDVDADNATVTVGTADDLLCSEVALDTLVWNDGPITGRLLAQCSAHGPAHPADVTLDTNGGLRLQWVAPVRRVAPGQSVVLYADDEVVGGGIAC